MKKMISVLLIDDEPMILKSVSRYLQMRNCNITACADGHSAIKIAENQRFDAAVADFNLPNCNGLHVLQHLQAKNPECRLVMTSGSTEPDNISSGPLSDSIAFLSKPFELESLLELINT